MLDPVLAGDVDALVGGWTVCVPRERLAELRADPRVAVDTAPGSSDAADDRHSGVDPELGRIAAALRTTTDAARRRALFTAAQRRIDEAASIVPLLVPHRVVVRTADLPVLRTEPDLYRSDPRAWAERPNR